MLVYKKKGIGEATTNLVKKLILKGFDYKDLESIIIKEFKPKDQAEYNELEDIVYHKIERYSNYITIENLDTNYIYYYMTVKELALDTGLTIQAINSSILEDRKIHNKQYKIEKNQFSTFELSNNKEDLFKDKLGKLKTEEKRLITGKHLDSPLKVIDFKEGTSKVYKEGRMFCKEVGAKNYILSMYLRTGYKYLGRYKLEKVEV